MLSAWLHNKLYPQRFLLLLIALVCIFVINIIIPENLYGGFAQIIYLPFLIFASFVVFEHKKKIFYILAIAGMALIILHIVNSFLTNNVVNEIAFLYVFFFGGVLAEVIRQIYSTELISDKIVFAAICGLLLIGYCGFYLFLLIELYHPGSFNNLGSGTEAVNNLFYFSFITILTVGYGDITPGSWIAKNATVLVAILAYIYSWVVIATIVGEVTSRKTSGMLANVSKNAKNIDENKHKE